MPQRGPQLAVANAVSRGFAPVLASLYSFAMAHTSPSLPPTAADHALLQALTIIVPTYNRPAALARLLAYWAPLPVQLIVVDGSDQPAALPCLAGQPLRLRYVHQPVAIDARIRHALGLCNTEFAMFACDDEYHLADGLVAALQRLRSEPALSAVAGRCAAFICNEHGLQLGTYYNFLKGFGARQALASERVRAAAAHPPLLSGFYYSVCRSQALVTAAHLAFTRSFSCPYVQEVLFTLGLFMQGGMQCIPALVWMRNLQAPPVSNAQWNRKLDFSAWHDDAAHADEVAQMRGLIDGLYRQCLADGEAADALDDFFARLLQFDRLQASGQGTSQKAYPFALSAFLILCRQHGMPVDHASLHRLALLETEPLLAASEMAQCKSRISVW